MISLNKKKKFNEIRVIVKDKNSYRFEFVYKNQKFKFPNILFRSLFIQKSWTNNDIVYSPDFIDDFLRALKNTNYNTKIFTFYQGSMATMNLKNKHIPYLKDTEVSHKELLSFACANFFENKYYYDLFTEKDIIKFKQKFNKIISLNYEELINK